MNFLSKLNFWKKKPEKYTYFAIGCHTPFFTHNEHHRWDIFLKNVSANIIANGFNIYAHKFLLFRAEYKFILGTTKSYNSRTLVKILCKIENFTTNIRNDNLRLPIGVTEKKIYTKETGFIWVKIRIME